LPRDGAPDAVGAGGYQHTQTVDTKVHDCSKMSFAGMFVGRDVRWKDVSPRGGRARE
jgi:hypothetical protein